MLGYCSHGLCAFPNMVIKVNIATKSGKKGETYVALSDNVEALFTRLSAFPNMATNVNIAMQQGTKE